MTKTIYILNIGNFAPKITEITYPFIQLYAKRIGARIEFIVERRFPDWPITYEKLQIYELAKQNRSDWHIYIDSDALIHPECPDFTLYLPKGTISFHAPDLSSTRFRPNDMFLRDGRYLAPGNWFMVASDLCLDLWHPLEMSPYEAVAHITPTPNEALNGITAEHLVDDFALAYNMARYGLRFKSFVEIYKERGFDMEYLAHQYTMTIDEKATWLKTALAAWKLQDYRPGSDMTEQVLRYTKREA